MINIKNYIKESIFDNPKEIAKKDIKVQPKNKDELEEIIKNEINKYKPEETVDLNFIDTSKIRDMHNLFTFTSQSFYLYNYDVSEWDVSNVTDMNRMFINCFNFNCDLSKWDVRNVKDMSIMFAYCNKFEGTGLENWNVHNVINMNSVFYMCERFDANLSKWDVSNVTDMSCMFWGCKKFTGKGIKNWNFMNAEYMYKMFKGCTSLKKIPAWYNGEI